MSESLPLQSLSRGPSSASLGASAEGGRTGLVHSQTSDTPIEVDPHESRLRRLRKAIITGARLHQEQCPRWRCAMVTTTYRDDNAWGPRHMSDLLKHIRHWLARRGHRIRYAWVMELTKRGRPHYHLLVWLPRGLTLPKPDKQGWWAWGSTRIEWVRKAVGYAAKYASKGGGGTIPKGARLFGCGGHTEAALLEFRWWKLPQWLRDQVQHDDRCKPMPGGGWVSRATGEVFASPWRVLFRGGRVYLVQRGWIATEQ